MEFTLWFWLLNISGSEHTPEEIPALAPGVLQPSLVLLESGDVCVGRK